MTITQTVKCCVKCGESDVQTEIGWSLCMDCFMEPPPRFWTWPKVLHAVSAFALTTAIFFILASLYELRAHADPLDCGIDAPGVCGLLPTTPPALPTQVVNGDGTRMNCPPNGTFCWPAA